MLFETQVGEGVCNVASKKKELKNHKSKGNKKNKKKREGKLSKNKQLLSGESALDRIPALPHRPSKEASIPLELPAGIEVKDCGYGRGVFVTQSFESEAVIGQVAGVIISDLDHSSENCMDLGKHGVLEPAPPFQFLNHSCHPNCELVWEAPKNKKTGRRQPMIFVQSIRPIAPGEQLTLDYAWPAVDAIPCQCRSSRCRGWVVAEDELHLVPNDLAV